METSIEHIAGEDYCLFYANEIWSRNLAKKMYEEHPDEVKDFKEWEDGAIQCKIPFKCMQYIKWPIKKEVSDEVKEKRMEALKRAREAKEKKE